MYFYFYFPGYLYFYLSTKLQYFFHHWSLLQHTWFKWMGRYPALQKPAYDHSFESGVLEQGNIQ